MFVIFYLLFSQYICIFFSRIMMCCIYFSWFFKMFFIFFLFLIALYCIFYTQDKTIIILDFSRQMEKKYLKNAAKNKTCFSFIKVGNAAQFDSRRIFKIFISTGTQCQIRSLQFTASRVRKQSPVIECTYAIRFFVRRI